MANQCSVKRILIWQNSQTQFWFIFNTSERLRKTCIYYVTSLWGLGSQTKAYWFGSIFVNTRNVEMAQLKVNVMRYVNSDIAVKKLWSVASCEQNREHDFHNEANWLDRLTSSVECCPDYTCWVMTGNRFSWRQWRPYLWRRPSSHDDSTRAILCFVNEAVVST